jgi:hypothetical protein
MWDRDKICISFSGGRTSAVMTKKILEEFPEKEVIITFANTGLEHGDTLRFVNDCDKRLFGGKVVWLEAVVDPRKGIGNTYKVVDYSSAARNGEPYRRSVEKYGLFNPTNPSCTDKVKIVPMRKYLKDRGFLLGKHKRNYNTAIGIRADEVDRMSAERKKFGLVYPLIKWGYTKQMVLDICSEWDFDLRIDEHLGNCVGCFKKSIRKLATVSRDMPEAFGPWREMEEEFKSFKNDINRDPESGFRRIYRQNRVVDDIFEEANKEGFRPFSSESTQEPDRLDVQGGCGESCEVYSDQRLLFDDYFEEGE